MAPLLHPASHIPSAAPTRRQAKRVYWEKLKRDTRLFWDRKPSETELIIYLKNGSQLQVDGLEDPQRIEGQTSPPIKGIHITEMGNVKPDIWDYHIRPLLADNNGFAIIDGTPEGKNHYYRLSLYACGGVIPETKPLDGGYAENPEDDEWSFHTWFSSDVLPAKEIESARRQMDERSFAQEYEGTFISYDGSLYYNYDPERNTGRLWGRSMGAPVSDMRLQQIADGMGSRPAERQESQYHCGDINAVERQDTGHSAEVHQSFFASRQEGGLSHRGPGEQIRITPGPQHRLCDHQRGPGKGRLACCGPDAAVSSLDQRPGEYYLFNVRA
ncbi:MAG: hypothetical protein U5N56_00130 [Candidatus Marinimicrobia bacterium]|nr:hypothetical protein [Candidatus Neomarinimicrobiota bacterium]